MIRVVDSMCGTGKSTIMFKRIKSNPDKRYLYITPFLTEIEERVPVELEGMGFVSPSGKKGTKIKHFIELVKEGKNIASTHALFALFNPEIVDILIDKQYVLVIDEAISCVGLMSGELKHSDVKALLNGDFVIVDEGNRNKLSWNEEKYPEHDGKYSLVRNMCNMGVLYSFEDNFLMFEYPPKLLSELKEVYILTYLFNGSDMRCWLDIHGIPYEIVDNIQFGLRSDKEVKDIIRKNLEIVDNRKLEGSRQRDTTLSLSWYSRASSVEIDKYKAMMRSCVVMHKAKGENVFWTTFKSFKDKMQGAGYTRVAKDGLSPFLPCNTRATNKYMDRWLCMYACNIFKNPIEVRYLKKQGIEVDEDSYALSEMLQFVWRGCIRKGEPMKVLVLSKRMRDLLEGWLND